MTSKEHHMREIAFMIDFFIAVSLWAISGNLIFYLYDKFIIIIPDSVLKWILLILGSIIFVVVFSIYSILFLGRFGATIGKMVFGLKVVAEDGKPISYKLAAKRTYLLFKLGALWFMFDDNKEERPYDKRLNLRVIKRPLFKK